MADWGTKQLLVGIKMELWKIKNSEFRERDGRELGIKNEELRIKK